MYIATNAKETKTVAFCEYLTPPKKLHIKFCIIDVNRLLQEKNLDLHTKKLKDIVEIPQDGSYRYGNMWKNDSVEFGSHQLLGSGNVTKTQNS